MKNDIINYSISDQYVQPSRNIGSTSYYNVGTNTTTVVPWGTLDWAREIIATGLATTFYVALVYFVGHWFKVW